MKAQEKFLTLDFFRIVFSLCVVIGHTYCFFFQNDYRQLHGEEWTTCHNLAVTGFFILSGIFMARHFYRHPEEGEESFLSYQLGRLKRLMPPMLFVALIFLLLAQTGWMGKTVPSWQYWPMLMMLPGSGKVHGAPSITWYVAALFWCSWVISALYFIHSRRMVRMVFPFAFILLFLYMYGAHQSIVLFGQPLLFDWFSEGWIRGFADLIFGFELYFFAAYLKERFVMPPPQRTNVSFVSGSIHALRIGTYFHPSWTGRIRVPDVSVLRWAMRDLSVKAGALLVVFDEKRICSTNSIL